MKCPQCQTDNADNKKYCREPQAGLAYALIKSGDARRQSHLMGSLLKTLKAASLISSVLLGMPWRVEAYLLTQDYEEAEKMGTELLEQAKRSAATLFEGIGHRLLGEVYLNTDVTVAPSHLERAVSILKIIGAENELALAYAGMGRYHKHQGNVEQAREYLTKALEIFDRLGTLIEPDKVREELAALPQ